MKRALFSIATTIVSLYMILTYKSTPITANAAASTADQTEMTLPPDDTTGTADVTETTDAPTSTEAPSTTGVTVAVTTTTTLPQTRSAGASAAITTTTRPRPTTTTTAKPTTTQPPTTVAAKRVVDGSVVQTDYGPVQVSITVQGSKIVGIKALQLPSGGASTSINANASPKLQSQTLVAQSANIAGVSGATYTSKGWKTSLAAALKSAGM
jgi:uncharacterized protein with FMN-binding domain